MKNRKIYYGWVIVAASLVIFTVSWAIPACFAIFFKPLQDAFGSSRAAVSWAATIQLLTFAVLVIPAGWAIDRFNTQLVYGIAGLLTGGALILCSRVNQPWQLYLFYGLPIGIGLSICGPPIMAIIVRWFTEKRGLALGIATAGSGIGGMLGAPATNWLITTYGWRNAFVIIGIVTGAAIIVCAFFMKSAPPIGMLTGKLEDKPKYQLLKPVLSQGMSLGQALRTKSMLLLALAQMPIMFTMRVTQVHIAPHALDLGISKSAAALIVSVIGAAGIAGRIIMGLAQDKIGPQRVMFICLGIEGITMLLLPFMKTETMLLIFGVFFGFAYGGDIPQMTTLAALCFGLSTVGITYGFISSVGNFAGALGPETAGHIFDTTGSYAPIFLATGVSLLVSFFLIWKLKVPKQS
jgi:MFS family permease